MRISGMKNRPLSGGTALPDLFGEDGREERLSIRRGDAWSVIIVFIIVFLLSHFVYGLYLIPSDSMADALQPGDRSSPQGSHWMPHP